MWRIALFVLASIDDQAGQASPGVRDISCLGNASIVGINEDLRVVFYDGARWVPSGISERVSQLWRSPDGRVVAWTTKPEVLAISPGGEIAQWRLPDTASHPSFASVDGLVAVTSERMYRLESGAVVKDIGPTPASLSQLTHFRGPVLLRSDDGPVVCFGTSIWKSDDTQGHCVRHGPRGYHYSADFGDPGAVFGEVANATPPFVCGDVVISTRKGATQIRRLSNGGLVARSNVLARRGSECLPDRRALIVGRREVVVFDLPSLHHRWRRDLKATIKSAVVCGGKITVLLENTSDPMTIDVPASLGSVLGD